MRRALALWLTQVHLRSRLPGGRKKGLREGRKKGRREGEAALLLRKLTRRFDLLSPAIEERVQRADADRLLAWGERFVTATKLDEVFDSQGG